MKFIDTHAHLYDEYFLDDLAALLAKAQSAHVEEIYLPNCDQYTIPAMMHICKQFPQILKPMMGLHPCYVKEDYKKELEIVTQWLAIEKFAAVGEIGLDYYWDLSHVAEQQEAFKYQIELAIEYQLPIVIHTRESLDDGIAIVREKQNGNLKGIFHCFSGNLEQAKAIIDLGFHIGIGGVVTYKKSDLPDIIAALPLEAIVLETDAPYLAPMPHRGKKNESAYIPIIAQKIADIKNLSIEDVARITTTNAQQIFKF